MTGLIRDVCGLVLTPFSVFVFSLHLMLCVFAARLLFFASFSCFIPLLSVLFDEGGADQICPHMTSCVHVDTEEELRFAESLCLLGRLVDRDTGSTLSF